MVGFAINQLDALFMSFPKGKQILQNQLFLNSIQF
jgi:hypothetical protein